MPSSPPAVLQVLSSLAGAMTTQAVVDSIVSHAAVFEAELLIVYLKRGDVFEMAGYGGSPAEGLEPFRVLPLAAPAHIVDAIRKGEPVYAEAGLLLESQALALGTAAAVSRAILPFLSEDGCLGALFLARHGRSFDPSSRDLLAMIAQNVAQALRRAEVLRAREAEAELAERLLAMVSHDLRTPLSAVGLGFEVLKKSVPESRPMVERMVQSTHRMQDIVNTVMGLSAARPERCVERERGRVPVEALFAELLGEFRLAFPERTFECDPGGLGRVCVHRARVEQMLSNLLRNAHHYGEPGSPIALSAERREDSLVLSVQNVGPPVPESLQACLFEPYRHGTASTGLGLGLYIVQKLVTLEGGQVQWHSRNGGTTFSLKLPWRTSRTAHDTPPRVSKAKRRLSS